MGSPRAATLLLACLALPGIAGATANRVQAAAHASETAALGAGEDPFRPVYVLMSRQTWAAGLQDIAREPQARRDSIGRDLVLARVSAHQLGDLSEFIHERERRCGGYFAFDTQAQAEAFLRADRSREAMQLQALPSYTIDNQATVNPWLPQVAEANLRGTIASLSTNWPNRYFASTHGASAATWIRDKWQSLAAGRSDVSVALYNGCGNCSTQPSVILSIQGSELPNEVVVLGGHLDSISSTGTGNLMNAPGADDDASGIASLTEVLRVALASGWKPKRSVRFMAYAAEEVGLRGSAAIAASYKAQGVNVVGALQLDMTNYRSGSPYDMQLVSDYSNASLQQFLRDLFDTYLKPLGLARGSYTCGYACSDHGSWTSNGYPAAFMYEGGSYAYLHTPSDTLATMGNTAQPSVALTKLGLAFLGELGKTSGGSGGGGSSTVLANNATVGAQSATAGNSLNYTLVVPANSSSLKFASAGGSGNADLYVRFGSPPTDTSYDCRPYRFGSTETCSFVNPQAGTWHVRLKARTNFSGVSLTPSYVVGTGGGGGGGMQTYSSSVAVPIPDNGTADSPIVVSGRSGNASSASVVAVNISHARRGDLRVRLFAPDGSSYALKAPSATDNAPNVVATYTVNLSNEALNGTWKLRVVDTVAGNTGTINSWSISF